MRHPKKLLAKARKCKVTATGKSWTVDSPSGSDYRVAETPDGRFQCGCRWHEYHSLGECSHVIAVRMWIAQAGPRRVTMAATVEEFKRSHRRFEEFNDNIIYGSRAA